MSTPLIERITTLAGTPEQTIQLTLHEVLHVLWRQEDVHGLVSRDNLAQAITRAFGEGLGVDKLHKL